MTLGERIKTNYENPAKSSLLRKVPVVIRVDGKAFHTFTKGMKLPYDEIFHEAMNLTAKFMCENVQNCRFAYTQSDEISLILLDDATYDTEPFLDNQVEKIVSITASMATLEFNRQLNRLVSELPDGEYKDTMMKAVNKGATFDSRCFNIPFEEIVNYLIYRQFDTNRNAIQTLKRCYLGKKKDLNNREVIEIGVDFDKLPNSLRLGVILYKNEAGRGWVIDGNTQSFVLIREWIEEKLRQI